jgi:uncharacterized protein (DUF58 family)
MVLASVLWLVAAAFATASAPLTVDRQAGRLRLELSISKPVYVVGEPVEARLVARNEGDVPLRVQFGSAQRFDLIVRRRGALVWRWSHDKAFAQVVREVTLRPGESLAFSAPWGQVDLQGRRAEPGEYEIVGAFLGRGPDLGSGLDTPPLEFRIAP